MNYAILKAINIEFLLRLRGQRKDRFERLSKLNAPPILLDEAHRLLKESDKVLCERFNEYQDYLKSLEVRYSVASYEE